MSDTKHTPGPWRVEDDVQGCKNIFAGTDAFATVHADRDSVAYTHGIDEAEDAANARLIAAAPDLLAMLQKWYEAEYDFRICPTKEEIEAVLAKASG